MSVAALTRDVLDCLAGEHPAAHAHFRNLLGQVCVQASVDGELVLIEPERANAVVVAVSTNLDTLCSVLLGESDVLDAILEGRLELRGAPNDLVSVADAMVAFVEGAMRCVSIERYVDRLLNMRGERWSQRRR